MSRMRIGISLVITICIVSISFITTSMANPKDSENPWRGGPHIGVSPYMGIIGAEVQNNYIGITMGLPGSLGIRYYPGGTGDRFFLGLHGMYYVVKENSHEDNFYYNEIEEKYLGGGLGYKLRMKDHWDLTFSISLVHWEERFKNNYATKTDKYLSVFPGITFGYTF